MIETVAVTIDGAIPGSRQEDVARGDQEVGYHQRFADLARSRYLTTPLHVSMDTQAMCNAACDSCPYVSMHRKGDRMSRGLSLGDVTSSTIVEIYNDPARRHLRDAAVTRQTVDVCRGCNHFG